jgi:hypothetical protein
VQPRSARYARAALERAVTSALRGRALTVLGPEDFVLFKVLSSRDRDLEDAASVLRRSGRDLDCPLIEREVALLAAEIADHTVAGRWERVRELAAGGAQAQPG